MSKKKTFRRVKVGNRGYVSGKRLQGFYAQEKKQKTPASAAIAGGGGVEQTLNETVSASNYTR